MARYLLCRVGKVRLALPLEKVRRVAEPSPAGAAGGVEGRTPAAVELEGKVIPLLDLSGWSGVPPGRPENLIVLEEKGLTLGLFVDKMLGIRDEKTVKRHDVPARLGGFCRGLGGLVQAGGTLYLLLEPAALARHPE